MSDSTDQNTTNLRRPQGVVAWPATYLPHTAVKMLADEVVVQLASQFRPQSRDAAAQPGRHVDVDVPMFTRMLLHDTLEAAIDAMRQERRDGVPMQVIYLHTLAGAARLMGEMWERDELSFLDMTVATGRIFSIMRELRAEARSQLPAPLPRHHALFAAIPGETHVLGATMAADLMRERGWQITLRSGLSHEALLDSMANEHHALIGLSASLPESLQTLSRLVVALRIVQPWAYVFVAGGIVGKVDGLVDIVGADAVLTDVDGLSEAMERMIDMPPRDET